MARKDKETHNERSLIDTIKEDRYIMIMVIAIVIFLASASLALVGQAAESYAPSGLSSKVEGNLVLLEWNPSTNPQLSGYDVYRSSVQGALGSKVNSAPIKKSSYSERVVPGTYYYTVRAVWPGGDDANKAQVMAQVLKVVPSSLSLVIGDGNGYAKSQTVPLSLSAKDAKECRYANDEDTGWGPWEPYMQSKSWTLSAGSDGLRVVAYQCRNTAESEVVSQQVVLDRSPPKVENPFVSVSGQSILVNVLVKDDVSTYVECSISVGALAKDFTLQLSPGLGGYISASATLDPGVYSVSASCTDAAGNTASATTGSVRVG